MTKLYQVSKCYKPLYVEVKGKPCVLNSFVFYNKDGIIFKTNRGWLENGLEPEFDFEVVKKIKENFTKKEAYVLKSKEVSLSDVSYDLYIHADLVGLKEPIYKIYSNMVYAKYESDIENFTFDVYVESLDKDLRNIKREITILSKELTHTNFDSKTLESIIGKFTDLKEKLKTEEKRLKEYTIEDYVDSIK